jgi:ankyrin repeat domain-containing protein 50
LTAIRLNTHGSFGIAEGVDEDLILEICGNLLVIDSERQVWRFSHLSVMEFWEENHWSLWQAHCHVARSSLLFLLETYKADPTPVSATPVIISSDNSVNEVEKLSYDIYDLRHPFQEYNNRYWVEHIQFLEGQEPDSELSHLLKTFLGSPNNSSMQYRRWHVYLRKSDHGYSASGETTPETASVFAMCFFSFYTLLADWWADEEIDLSQVNARGNGLLHIAAAAGSVSICAKLLERGIIVDMELQTRGYGSALANASVCGNIDVVKLLIENGADVNLMLQAGNYGSALAAASCLRNIDIVKLLTENGAEVNMKL